MSVVGIDLGTTNTVVGCVRAGKVHILADQGGLRLLPSVVSFHPNGEVLVGGAAKSRRIIDAANTIYSHKRLIGRSWASPEIAQARQRFAFELREGPSQGPLIHARGQDYTLPEISAFVLKRARLIAERAVGTPVERAVVTVPAHFNELQRASTKIAARVAGLEVLRILNEPTAAALAYGLGRSGNERVAVYDFGGGTFDCTLLDLNGNVFEVLASAGDSFLGGDDIDNAIADRMADYVLQHHRVDVRADVQTYERLKAAAEEVKIGLSMAETHTAVVRELGHAAGGASLDVQFTLTRRDLEAMITPLIDRTFKVTQDALALARLSPTSFDKVILVGGSTRIPAVRKRVEAFFGTAPMDRVNPEEVVAIGAAIQAAALTEGLRRRSIPAPPIARSTLETDDTTRGLTITPAVPPSARSLGNAAAPMTARMANAPADTTDVFQTAVDTPKFQTSVDTPTNAFAPPGLPRARESSPRTLPLAPLVDPPQRPSQVPPAPSRPSAPLAAQPPQSSAPPPRARTASMPALPPPAVLPPSHRPSASAQPVAMPSTAPAQAATSPVLVDVTPRGLVVETVGNFSDTIIPRNSRIPCERTRRFSTSRDMQTTVRIRVAQGEDKAFGNNTYLGEVELTGLRAAARGGLTIAVTFEVDADGTLRVQARDVQTGQQANAMLQLIGIADESSVVLMINRLAHHPVGGSSS